ncbi:MAG: glutamate-cysteine ligase family protein, partial [Pseudomonadota bacterium]|nr:glutamate-cysteine ligase family protein [Pseudomonadota bacterium]
MAASSQSGGESITGKAQLVEYLEGGCKPREQWRIGTEHEKGAFDLGDFSRLKYDGSPGIAALLEGLMRFDWEPVCEGENVIALRKPDGASVSLEPGGQFELSGAMLETIHQTCNEVHTHLDEVKTVCE